MLMLPLWLRRLIVYDAAAARCLFDIQRCCLRAGGGRCYSAARLRHGMPRSEQAAQRFCARARNAAMPRANSTRRRQYDDTMRDIIIQRRARERVDMLVRMFCRVAVEIE